VAVVILHVHKYEKKARISKKKVIEHKMCVLIFCTTCFMKNF